MRQALLYGAFRVYIHQDGEYILLNGAEGMILGDDLSDSHQSVIKKYADERALEVYTRDRFVREIFLPEVHGLGALCIGFNLPFDLSRLAVRATYCRKRGWKDGFTLYMADTKWLPALHIKLIDSKRSFIEFGAPAEQPGKHRDRSAIRRQPGKRHTFSGRFLDLKTLAFALTGEGHSLESACGAFGITYQKRDVQHGIVAMENLVYNREDLDATWRLFHGAIEEWNKHPFTPVPAPEISSNTPPEKLPERDPSSFVVTRAYSPASVGKAYLRAMGVRPRREVQPDFSKDVLGAAMVAYYGGRSECHIRREIVPVTYLDVLSMYPTVCTLMDLWRIVIADKVEVVDATQEAQAALDHLSLDELYRHETWRDLLILAEIAPDQDILPIRTEYEEGADYQIGVNVATAEKEVALWYMLPDLVASKLLAGKTPRIRRALKFRSVDVQPNLRSVKLLREIEVIPQHQDFFRTLIEKRHEFQKLQKQAKASGNEDRARHLNSIQLGLKIIANATSYGIFAEIDERDTGATRAEVHGLRGFVTDIAKEEHPGPYAFAPLAALITSAARLMLAMVEVELTTRGATYVFCDTDSMAVAGEQQVVHAIRQRFSTLIPYTFEGDLLKIEDENTPAVGVTNDPALYCYGISAKRYVLFNIADDEGVIIRKPLEHGLGHLMSPSADKEEKQWMSRLWQTIVEWERGTLKHGEGLPFADLPALGRFPISRYSILRRFEALNTMRDRQAKKRVPLPYFKQVKPFNFMLVAYPDTGDIATGGEAYWSDKQLHSLDRKPIRPIAPYESDPQKWHRLQWVDLHTGRPVRLAWTEEPTYLATGRIRVQTYRDVVRRHLSHPESKAAGPNGQRCESSTTGTLQRLHADITLATHVGKESQDLEEVQAWLTSPTGAVVLYSDGEAEWRHVCQILKRMPLALIQKESALSRATIKRARNARRRPHPAHRRMLAQIALRWERTIAR